MPIEEVKDEVFASKAMGDGFAVVPTVGEVVSPVDGEIILIAQTSHAVGLKTKKGIEVLVHIGLDTVELNGKGFTVKIKQGMKVKAGDPLVSFDSEYMKNLGIDMTTMVVFTSPLNKSIALNCYGEMVQAGQTLIEEIELG
ncbi:PTS glucose transporter subunit IIA [Allocoprobacillus halotolerans]|uniref:PTS glucose transporter subunit IIA n=1 Tax=Allocoprobacillus halotolerans TaxID=2944914 RepID=A0ABY5I619_9FIRM|nr:PTS glucose transporter subunit IIA [Allocoprobacillus halotolerans]UTY40811.1 PTS glucose transporter subunit IIA [Allocoprobacillus halotolerans]